MADDEISSEAKSVVGDAPIKVGTILANRFEIRRELGVGSVGICFAVFDRNHEQEVCLKVIRPALLKDSKTESIFVEAAKIACDLRHPEIVNVYDIHRENGLFFLSMELLKGKTLRQEMEERKAAGRVFELSEVKALAESVGRALEYAHQFTLHRSLKPEAIWITDEGRFKITDFGLSRGLTRRQTTMTSVSSATAYYLPPELMDEEKEMDARGDQYSLAVVLYELLTGEPVAGMSRSIQEVRREVSEGVSKAIARALSPSREERFESIADFVGMAVDGFEPGFIRRHARMLVISGFLVSILSLVMALLNTDNRVDRWIRSSIHPEESADLELRAHRAKADADAKQQLFESTWLNLIRDTQTLLRKIDLEKEAFAKAIETNRFNGDWDELRDQAIDMVRGFGETNVVPPEFMPDGFDQELAKPLAALRSEQEGRIRLLAALAKHVFRPDLLARLDRDLWTADQHLAAGQYQAAESGYSEVSSDYTTELERIRFAKQAASLLHESVARKVEYLAIAHLNEIPDESPLNDQLARMNHVSNLFETGEFSAVVGEFSTVLEGLNLLSENAVRPMLEAAKVAELEWEGIFVDGYLPRLPHLDSPGSLIAEGEGLMRNGKWFEANEAFRGARSKLQDWIDEIRALPISSVATWTNSLEMQFVQKGDIKVSIWETRVMDFDVFVQEDSYDAGPDWRTFGLKTGFVQGPTHPVVWIEKKAMDAFCEWLTHEERKKGVIDTNQIYRLPSDLEWSMIVGLSGENEQVTPRERSGGVGGVFPWHRHTIFPPTDTGPKNGNYGSFVSALDAEDYSFTAPVGRMGQRFGLYDVGGNVWEMCDYYYDDSKPEDGWTIRGGSYRSTSKEQMQSSYRSRSMGRSGEIGFRVVLGPLRKARNQLKENRPTIEH